MNPLSLIEKYTVGNQELQNILFLHSKMVADLSLKIAAKHPEMNLDTQFLFEAAMLHDIGIVKTNAPAIFCYGTEHYLRHGVLGGEILRSEGLPKHARIAERHTGTGLTVKTIIEQNLPLAPIDLQPVTLEEQLICYADKFYSKTHLEYQKSTFQVEKGLLRFGKEGIDIFRKWILLFGDPSTL